MDWNSKQQLVNYRIELSLSHEQEEMSGIDLPGQYQYLSVQVDGENTRGWAWCLISSSSWFLERLTFAAWGHCSMYTWGLFIGYWAWLSCIWPRITVFIHDDDGDGDIPLPARKQATLDGMESQIRSCLIKSENSFLNFG